MNKPKIYKNKSEFLMYGCLMGAVHGLWKRRQYGEIRDIALSEAAAGWNACQASMHAQLDEKNREIIRIAKNYAYCLALLKNLVDKNLLSNEAMEEVNNFIKQSEGL